MSIFKIKRDIFKIMNIKKYSIFILAGTGVVLFFGFAWVAYLNISDEDKKKNIIVQEVVEIKPVWEKKIKTQEDLRVGIITDTHIRPTRFNKKDKSPSALRYIKEDYLEDFINFNEQMNIFYPNAIVHLGDIVEGTDDPDYVSLSGIDLVKNELLKNNVPIYWLIGNHELRSITKEQFKTALGLENFDYFKDIGDYRFIFLDGNFNPSNANVDFVGQDYIPGFVHPKTLMWLEELLKTEKRVFVFMHQAVVGMDFFSNEEIYKNAIANWREVMNLFEKYNVEAFFNGHIENKYYKEINGVKYYSLPGTKKSLEYPRSFYELLIEKGVPKMTMYYLDSETKQYKVINFETGEEI